MSNFNFKVDLQDGELGEKLIRINLEGMNAKFISWNDDRDNTHDLVMGFNDKIIKYEIKTDYSCRPDSDTGNMFIEYSSRDKDSGLLTTKADWFVYYFIYLGEIYYINVSDLKELLVKFKFKLTDGGDGGTSNGYLIPRYQYSKYFIVKKVKPIKFDEIGDLFFEEIGTKLYLSKKGINYENNN